METFVAVVPLFAVVFVALVRILAPDYWRTVRAGLAPGRCRWCREPVGRRFCDDQCAEAYGVADAW